MSSLLIITPLDRTFVLKSFAIRSFDRYLGVIRTLVRSTGENVAEHSGRLATEVRARRTQLRLRQQELADLAGVSERFVHALENGKQTVQLDKVQAVLAALGLHLEMHRGVDRDPG